MSQKVRICMWKTTVYFEFRKFCGHPLCISFPECYSAPLPEAEFTYEILFKCEKYSTFFLFCIPRSEENQQLLNEVIRDGFQGKGGQGD